MPRILPAQELLWERLRERTQPLRPEPYVNSHQYLSRLSSRDDKGGGNCSQNTTGSQREVSCQDVLRITRSIHVGSYFSSHHYHMVSLRVKRPYAVAANLLTDGCGQSRSQSVNKADRPTNTRPALVPVEDGVSLFISITANQKIFAHKYKNS